MTTRTIWSVDLRLWATAYVQADTREEAEALIRAQLLGSGLEVAEQPHAPAISGAEFDDPDLPGVSLSPAMTIDQEQPDGWAARIVTDEDEDEEDEAA